MKIKLFAATVLALSCATTSALADDVKYYDRAPSVDELQKQLLGTPETGAPHKPRTRAIVFGDDPPPSAREPEPQARPAQTTERPSSYAPPVASSAPARPNADRAIAFPINFTINSAQILPDAIPFLESVAGLMQKDRSIRLMIEGHTDSTGSASRNLVLSRERAYAVKDYLIDHFGIDPARFIAVGKGSDETLEGLPSSHPRNRRVQFRIAG